MWSRVDVVLIVNNDSSGFCVISDSSLLNSEQGEGNEHDEDIDDVEYGASSWGTVISEVESTDGKECICMVFFLLLCFKGISFFVDVLLLLWVRFAAATLDVETEEDDGEDKVLVVAGTAGLERARDLLDANDEFEEPMWELVDIMSIDKEPSSDEDEDAWALPTVLVLVCAKDNGGGIREDADTILLLL